MKTPCCLIGFLSVLLLCSCHSSERYKYIKDGDTQVRIDERAGRTDRLTNIGWIPISFDKPSVKVPETELKRVSATLIAKDIFDVLDISKACYTVDNDSQYVLKEVWIDLPVRELSADKNKNVPLLIPIDSQSGGFAPVGGKFPMCYHGSHIEPNWDTRSASIVSATGWKQD